MKRTTLIFFLFFTFCVSFGQIVHTFQKTYGLIGYNYGRCSFQTDDGGYIILGNKTGFTGGTDIYLVKTDTVGKIIWDKAIGGTEIEWANDFKITHDKGYIIAGYTNALFGNGYDVLLVKTDSLGVVQWSKVYGGTDWDMGHSVIEDKDHNYLVAGETYSNSFGDADVYLIKTDSVGDTLWTKHYGGTGMDIGYSIDTTYTSSYVVAGVTRKLTDTTYDAYLLGIKNNGDTIFTKKYGDSLDDKFYCARQVDDTSYIACGSTKNYGAQNYDQWIVKMDTSGNLKWMRIFVNSGDEELFDIKQSWNQGFVATGYTTTWGAGGSDVTATEYNNGGWYSAGNNFGGAVYDVSYSINLTKDSGYVCTGTTESFGIGMSNIYFIKTNKSFLALPSPTHEIGIIEIKSYQDFYCNVYPNPTTDLLMVNINNAENKNMNLKVIDILGRELISESFISSNSYYNKAVSLADFADGVYFVKVSNDKYSSCFKIIKQTSR